jgi:hypothetical protein
MAIGSRLHCGAIPDRCLLAELIGILGLHKALTARPHRFHTGQTPVKKYVRQEMQAIM